MLKRFLTSIVIVIFIVGFFALRFVSPNIFDIFAGIIALGATYEVCRVFEKSGKKNDKYFILAYPVLIYLTLLVSLNLHANVLIYLAIAIILSVLILFACYIKNLLSKTQINKEMVESNYTGNFKNYVKDKLKNNLFLLFYPAFLLSLLFLVNHISSFASEINDTYLGFMLLVMTFATTVMTDTGAYIIGCGLRGKKLCPSISPNKTISGAIGGLICSISTSLLLYAIFHSIAPLYTIISNSNLSIWLFIFYGLIASVVSQAGDLFASYIKRKNNVKDYGTIFPGHGGFMDRVDGTAFNLVWTLLFAIVFIV